MTKTVKCPYCGKPAEYTTENQFRPFCSERCKLIDLGDWAEGRYAIPVSTSPEPEEIESAIEAALEEAAKNDDDDLH